MSLCETCKHFVAPERLDEGCEPSLDNVFGACQRIKHDYEARRAASARVDGDYFEEENYGKWLSELERLAKEEKALAHDGSGYHASIRVAKDFGCVLHEEQPR